MGGRSGAQVVDHLREPVAGDELKAGLTQSEGHGFRSEIAGGDEDAFIGPLGNHDAEELADSVDADAGAIISFALHQYPFPVLAHVEVDSSVRSGFSSMVDLITPFTIVGRREVLKLLPRDVLDVLQSLDFPK